MKTSIEATLYREMQWDAFADAEEDSNGAVELSQIHVYLNTLDITDVLSVDEIRGVGEALLDAYDRARPTKDDEIDRRRRDEATH